MHSQQNQSEQKPSGQHQDRDMNRDPISGAAGSHPVGVGVGGVTGAAAGGALAGTAFGPIGTLVGAGLGVVAGAAAGKGVAERIDPTGETEYWRNEHQNRPHAKSGDDFDRDFAAAYGFGLQAREQHGPSAFERSENDLRADWERARGESRLSWDEAKSAARDSYERADRTYDTYEASDKHFQSQFEAAGEDGDRNFDEHRPAYRFGVHARTRYGDRPWDQSLQDELRQDWERGGAEARMDWEQALPSIQEAYGSPYIQTRETDDRDNPGAGLFRVR
ncbi:hypothetical protein [Lysobacter sp. D1-1-M9]|uniref:hypothetical protein n=1 Tax=Novilysobacter longmucuonensis TaxID=3098603 RepID=UPI002FC64B25